MSAMIPDDEMKIDNGASVEDRDQPGGAAVESKEPLRVHSFQRQIESMQWRIDAFRSDDPDFSSAVSEALQTTMEELRVTVEELRQTNESLVDSRAELEAERRRYRDLFELAPDAYLVTDLLGVIREANRAALAQLNIEARFLVGKPLVLFLPEASRNAFRLEISRLRGRVEAGSIAEYDLRLRPRKLAPFDATIHVGVERDLWGRPVALRWIVRDVSAKKQAEEKIRALNAKLEHRVLEGTEQLESVLQTNERWLIKAHAADPAATSTEGLFREIVEEVDAILWRGDTITGRYTFVSKRAEELLGYPSTRWIEEPDFWLERIHPEDRDWAASYRRKQLRERLDHEAEYRVVAADGRTLWFREIVRVIRHQANEPAILYGLMVNITKRKKVERQLYTAKGELASQLRDMTYLHELFGRLTNARGLPATGDEVLSGTVSLQGAEMALLWLQEPGVDRPAIVAQIGIPEFFHSFIQQAPPPLESMAIEDVETEPEGSPWREAARVGGFRGVAVVPLFDRDGKSFGAVASFFQSPYRMGERQARLVEIYAEQAAEAIDAARLIGQIEEADRRKGKLLEVKSREMKAPLEAILEAARDSGSEPIERQARQLIELLGELVEGVQSSDRHKT